VSVTAEDIWREFKPEADITGYRFTDRKEELDWLLEGLAANVERYGYPLCPCRMGAGDIAADRDIICPCDYRDADLAQYGQCY
jgi:ferredoxin-thioredoxin reductase catalytic subunit